MRKEGPNQGRPFYGCSNPQDSRCQFFVWADQPPDAVASSSQRDPPIAGLVCNRADNITCLENV